VDTLGHAALGNAVLVVLMAPVAALAARVWRRRPAVVHSLWLLVLLKFVTPSLVQVPLPRWPEPANEVVAANPVPAAVAEAAGPPAVILDQSRPIPAPSAGPDFSWGEALALVWAAGSLAWCSMVGVQVVRFRRLLRLARPAPADVAARVERLSAAFGLRRPPGTWFVPARVPPMVWALAGPARLLLPDDLWGRLSDEQRDAVLAHELAHLRRGDPWVRRLEAVVLGLYWWHPVAWWARREVGRAEEECCDAWVVWALPAAAGAYAEALVATASYLSGARPALPVGASGAGLSRDIRFGRESRHQVWPSSRELGMSRPGPSP
jgi:bla regulator protein BlaR1